MKTGFEKSREYKRILEILDDYWISEPDEEQVQVTMQFIKKNGEHQEKCIVWHNHKGR